MPRRQLPAFTCATRSAPLLANGPGLALDAGKKRGVAFALQPHPDKRTKDDLEAHRQLEHGRRSARDDASMVQRVLRKNEKKSCPVLEHLRSRLRVEGTGAERLTSRPPARPRHPSSPLAPFFRPPSQLRSFCEPAWRAPRPSS